jgi:hypothetical protein
VAGVGTPTPAAPRLTSFHAAGWLAAGRRMRRRRTPFSLTRVRFLSLNGERGYMVALTKKLLELELKLELELELKLELELELKLELELELE